MSSIKSSGKWENFKFWTEMCLMYVHAEIVVPINVFSPVGFMRS